MGLQIKEILKVAANILKEAGIEESKIDAELILSYVISYDSRRIFMNWAKELDDDYCETYFELIQERASGKPTQYITKKQAFMGYNFFVDERVLIPRMDTEILVEAVLSYIENNKGVQRVLDLCTGSGIIAVSLAKKVPSLKITAIDIDDNALDVAEKNVSLHKVSSRVKLIESDLFDEVKMGFGSKKFDIIVSNPPYIRTDVLPSLQKEIYDYEPIEALDGGPDGLDYYRDIIEEAPGYLSKNGALFFEIGYDQADEIMDIMEKSNMYKGITVLKDLNNYDRVIYATLKRTK